MAKRKAKLLTVEDETARLKKIFKGLPPKKLQTVEGLIIQAARLRVRLDALWNDIQEHGEVEWFNQSDKTEPYEKERPASKIFTATDKSYQAIIKQLTDMCPEEVETDSLTSFMKDYE